MSSVASSPFTPWQNFYLVTGSAAGALTGLQFVVMVLVAQIRIPSEMRDIRAFGTPTVVSFCMALFISAFMVMPWPEATGCEICLATIGLAGLIYSIRVVLHARNALYSPDLEDWVWYTALPVLAHLSLLVAACLLTWNSTVALFTIAIDCLLFLTLGIHNSWDAVTYLAIKHGNPDRSVNVPSSE